MCPKLSVAMVQALKIEAKLPFLCDYNRHGLMRNLKLIVVPAKVDGSAA